MSRAVSAEPSAARASAETFTARALPARRLMLASVILAELLAIYVVLANGGWVFDDNLILALAGHEGLTWHWLTSVLFQHWGIGYHFLYSAIHKLMPVDYRWALAGMLLVLGASMWLFDAILRRLFGWRWLALAGAAYLGVSVAFVRALQWPAGGFSYLPNTLCDLVVIYAYLRYAQGASRRWIWVACAALGVGLLMYEKPAYMLLYLPLMRLLLLSEGNLRATGRRMWEERWFWLGLVAVVVVWAVGFEVSGGGQGVSSGTVTLAQYLHYFKVLWLQTLSPAFAGLTLPASSLAGGQIAEAVAIQVALVVIVAVSLRLRRDAWRAWAYLLACVVLSGVLVARARVARFGVGSIAGDLRYVVDFAWIAPLAACFAFARWRSVGAAALEPAPGRWGSVRGRPVVILGVVVLAAYLGAAVASAVKLQRDWDGPRARTWEATLMSSTAAFERHYGRPVLADDLVPPYIVGRIFIPVNRLSWIVPLYVPGAQVDGPIGGRLAALAPSGQIMPARVASRWGSGDVGSLQRQGRLSIAGAAPARSARGELCLTTSPTAPGWVIRRLGGSLDPARGPYYLQLTYRTTGATKIPVFVDAGRGYAPSTDRLMTLARGRGRSIEFLVAPSPRAIRLELFPGTSLCLSRIDVITIARQG